MASKPEFGVSSSKFGGGQRGGGNQRGRGRGNYGGKVRSTSSFKAHGLPTGGTNDVSNVDQKFEDVRVLDSLEVPFGFERYQEGPERLGWLLNMHEVNNEWKLHNGSFFIEAY